MRPNNYRVWDTQSQIYINRSQSGAVLLNTDGVIYFDTALPYIGELFVASADEPERYIVEFDTGRKDKFGVPIYDGDLIGHDDLRRVPKRVKDPIPKDKWEKLPKEPIVVEWSEQVSGYDPFSSQSDDLGPWFYTDNVEVLGNIHEHADLLQPQKGR
jgi:hypothetical protein